MASDGLEKLLHAERCPLICRTSILIMKYRYFTNNLKYYIMKANLGPPFADMGLT